MKKQVEFVRALVGLQNGKPVIQFERPSLNGFEERWSNAVTRKRIVICFTSNCPLTICTDPHTRRLKTEKSCNKECLQSNLARLNDFEKRIAKKTRQQQKKETS